MGSGGYPPVVGVLGGRGVLVGGTIGVLVGGRGVAVAATAVGAGCVAVAGWLVLEGRTTTPVGEGVRLVAGPTPGVKLLMRVGVRLSSTVPGLSVSVGGLVVEVVNDVIEVLLTAAAGVAVRGALPGVPVCRPAIDVPPGWINPVRGAA